ncbi:MAG: ATP-dependent helicase [Phycisphaerales bacterium]|nr:MAG: ATP-dependent helicase [Phycisphaerales bacterium]
MSSWLDELNPAQQEAVTHGDGPLLIVAGAGTGKTRTLACRVAYLIQQGVPADRILLLTFTRRAAAEMLSRAGQVTGKEDARHVWGGTFHATANRLLRIYGQALNLPGDFTVLDQSDSADLMNLIRNELGVAKKDRRFPRKVTLLKIYSRMVNAQEPLADTLETHFPWCQDDAEKISTIFDGYSQRKREQHLLDYDDLLLFWSALCAAPRVGEAVAGRFDHILVDEYQDTNPVQAEVLRGMREKCKNICVVGDDAQSIYSFRAATIRNILDFPKHFPDTRTVTLEQNYRSIRPILTASNAVMDQARERYTKNLWSERPSDQKPVLVTCLDEPQQCDVVCRHILDHLEGGIPLMHQAVLFRAGHHSAQLEVELARRNIPFRKYGGLKFVEAAHIKDMLAMLRILENPYDEISWFRVLQLLEGIGPRTASRIIEHLGVRRAQAASAGGPHEDSVATSPLTRLMTDAPTVPPAAREHFGGLRSVLAECSGIGGNGSPRQPRSRKTKRAKELPLVTQIERIRHFYESVFERVYDNAAIRLRDIEQLEQIAAGYRSRNRFLTDLTLDPPDSTSDFAGAPFLEEDFLILSTIHSAKGCEWTVVHIIHAADGMIPSDMAVGEEVGVEEERRLFYVAMTRAKDMLYVYFPLRYYHRRYRRGDGHGYAQLTRFMSQKVRALFETRSAHRDDDAEWDERFAADPDPYARIGRLWRE